MNRLAWQYYLRFYHGSYQSLILSILLSIIQSLFILPIAFLVRHIFDKGIPNSDIQSLIIISLIILVLIVLNSVFMLWTRYLSLNKTKFAIRDLREELLIQCYRYSRSFYNKADLGKLHASIVQDTQRLDVMSNAIISVFLPSMIMTIGLCCVSFYISSSLFFVMAISIPPLYLTNRLLIMRINLINASHRSFEKFSKGVLFVLQMMDLTRLQTAEHYEIEQQKKYVEEVRITHQSSAMLFTVYNSVTNGIVAVSNILILIIGGISVSSGKMTIGSLLSFYVAMSLLSGSVKTMVNAIPQIIEGNESLITLYNMSQIKDSPSYSGREIVTFRGGITLKSVCFGYANNEVLHSINLTIPPGAKVAIVGQNGAGKSTIVHLILGFYRPQKGMLYADSHPYERLDIMHLRRSIGVVMQNPIIFPGTIKDNMIYGCPDASMADVIQASELATAHEFINALPDGYDTLMGEKGVLLSGGQRQRIAIARALLRRPKLLILDEPTNHLDATSIRTLMYNLKKLDESPSILIISQNMEIANETDHVYVVSKDGCIVDSGNPEKIFRHTTDNDLIG